MLIKINSFYEDMIEHNIADHCVNEILITLSRLLAKKEFTDLSKYTGSYGVYHRLWNAERVEKNQKNPEAANRYKIAAERYFNVFKHVSIFQLEHAEEKRDVKAIDALIDKYHQAPEIRLWTLRQSYSYMNCSDEAGNSCLQRAVKANAVHRVAFLLSTTYNHNDFNINEMDSKKHTPLVNAIRLGHLDIAKLLMTHGATINRTTFKLAQKKHHPELAELIRQRLLLSHPKEKEIIEMNEYNVIVSTQSPLEQDNLDKTGDVDYGKSIAAQVQLQTTGRVQYCNTNTKQILDEQLQLDSKKTVLHLMINAPRTGFALDLPYLKQVKDAGCKIIMTAVEFAKHAKDEYKMQTLEYLHYAEQIIFLDEQDKNEALKCAKRQMPDLVERLNQAQVISVPPTISPQFITRKKTDSNIMCFGMVRTGKGFAHVMHLAELIKQSDSPFLKDKQIFIVGTVQSHKTQRNGTAYDAALFKLLTQLYPQYKERFFNKSPDELVALYQDIKNEAPALPIKLFLNLPENKLPTLFEQCEYAMYSAYRGVTLRNSSISTELGFGCIIFSFEDDITPKSLKRNGEHHEAMVIFDNSDYDQYATNIAEHLILREKDKKEKASYGYSKEISLNDRTRARAYDLLTNELSLAGVALKHQSVYQRLFSAGCSQEKESQLSSTPVQYVPSAGFFKETKTTSAPDNTDELPIDQSRTHEQAFT